MYSQTKLGSEGSRRLGTNWYRDRVLVR